MAGQGGGNDNIDFWGMLLAIAIGALAVLSAFSYAAVFLASLVLHMHIIRGMHWTLFAGYDLILRRRSLPLLVDASQRRFVSPVGSLVTLIVLILALAWVAWRLLTSQHKLASFYHKGSAKKRQKEKALEKERKTAFATSKDIAAHYSKRAVLEKAKIVRPDLVQKGTLEKVKPSAYAFYLGKDSYYHQDIYSSLEDTIMILGPPRMGKGVYFVNNFIVSAPGPVVATSTRDDTVKITALARSRPGVDVWVFDPQGESNLVGYGTKPLRWSPLVGCHAQSVASSRARILVEMSSGLSNEGGNGGFFNNNAIAILQNWFLAAGATALPEYQAQVNKELKSEGKPQLSPDEIEVKMDKIVAWSQNPQTYVPRQILERAAQVFANTPTATQWSSAAQAASQSGALAKETQTNIEQTIRTSLSVFQDTRILEQCTLPVRESFDAKMFLTRRNTLYLIGSTMEQQSVAPIMSVLLNEIIEAARNRGKKHPSSRCIPPLALILDEIANIAPIKTLPGILSDGSGSGICTVTVWQSRNQARDRYGDKAAEAIWESSLCKILLGGGTATQDLNDWEKFIGQITESTKSVSKSDGGKQTTTSERDLSALDATQLRQLPKGVAMVLSRNLPVVKVDCMPHYETTWYKEAQEQRSASSQQ